MARGQKKKGPVSGPGKLSQRTDLSPMAQATSPGGARPYGERKAIEQQVAAAPTPTQGGAPQPQVQQALEQGVFGPTQRPGEPATTGMPFGPGAGPAMQSPVPEDHDAMLRAMIEINPHPDLLRLLHG
jgi:hypothetical protein